MHLMQQVSKLIDELLGTLATSNSTIEPTEKILAGLVVLETVESEWVKHFWSRFHEANQREVETEESLRKILESEGEKSTSAAVTQGTILLVRSGATAAIIRELMRSALYTQYPQHGMWQTLWLYEGWKLAYCPQDEESYRAPKVCGIS